VTDRLRFIEVHGLSPGYPNRMSTTARRLTAVWPSVELKAIASLSGAGFQPASTQAALSGAYGRPSFTPILEMIAWPSILPALTPDLSRRERGEGRFTRPRAVSSPPRPVGACRRLPWDSADRAQRSIERQSRPRRRG